MLRVGRAIDTHRQRQECVIKNVIEHISKCFENVPEKFVNSAKEQCDEFDVAVIYIVLIFRVTNRKRF